jgi:hypothetical protein
MTWIFSFLLTQLGFNLGKHTKTPLLSQFLRTNKSVIFKNTQIINAKPQ